MKSKEKGYVLAVDPASNSCGVSLWKNGEFVAGHCLKSDSSRDRFSTRLKTILGHLEAFLDREVKDEKIETVVCESVKSRIVQICIGALMLPQQIDAHLNSSSFVAVATWKKWAQLRGAKGVHKDIKGVKALTETGWNMQERPVVSDDVADSILIYLAWRDRDGDDEDVE